MSPADELAVHLLRRGRPLRIKARGASMVPFLWDSDVAIVTPTEEREIRVGDVLCYEAAGRIFLHRLIERDGIRFLAKGDALACVDVIDRAQVLGKVVAVERHGRIRRLDTRAARWRSRVIVSLSPFLPRLLSLALRLRRLWRAASRG